MKIVGFPGLFWIFCGAAVGTMVDLPELGCGCNEMTKLPHQRKNIWRRL
ncbi:hypothetical protein Hdeb2414_s0010g00330981 [Helianthus debilis subsp. tardiflorus]